MQIKLILICISERKVSSTKSNYNVFIWNNQEISVFLQHEETNLLPD